VVSSTLCSPNPNTPESPLAVALPLAGLAIFAGAFGFAIRRRRRSASAV
jgi:LPXTG-motif cell wall-anchored protein